MDIGRVGNIGQTRGTVNPAFSVLAGHLHLGHVFARKVSAPFRLNARVFQMMALILAALIVPLLLMIVGVRQISFKPAGPAPEVPGLRMSLEQAAAKALPPPAGLGETRRVLVPVKGRSPGELIAAIHREAASFGGTAVEIPSEGGGGISSILVRVPGPSSSAFETALLPWLDQASCTGETGGGFFEIRVSQP